MRFNMLKKAVFLAIIYLSFFTFIFAQNSEERENYYKLHSLTQAGPPRQIKVIKISNIARGSSMLSEGILFTYRSRRAKRVTIAGNFSHWKLKRMTRGKRGVWFYFLDNMEGKNTIRYKFNIDGIWTYDPQNDDKIDDKAGSYVSLVDSFTQKDSRRITVRLMKNNRVEFRIYRPRALFISLVGDFNHWNPENDLLQKGHDGVWRITKRLPRGQYRYRYLIDGEPAVDIYNEKSTADDAGDLCSMVRIK